MRDELPDDDLDELLRDALEYADPVPEAVHEAALSALAFRDLDGELAELLSGSLAGVRDSADGPMVFAADHAEIAATIQDGRLLAQVAPPVVCTGEVRFANSRRVPIRTDELGRFAVDVTAGPARIVLDHPGGRIRTEWFAA